MVDLNGVLGPEDCQAKVESSLCFGSRPNCAHLEAAGWVPSLSSLDLCWEQLDPQYSMPEAVPTPLQSLRQLVNS